jgi:four helix bundle protein
MDAAEKNATFFRFEDLRIYHKALEYISWVHKATSQIDAGNTDNLTLKFNESAKAIALNIAEGSARNKSQFIYYLKMAKSSIRESLVYTSIAVNLGYFEQKEENESRGLLMEMTKMVGALISSLQRSPHGNREHDDAEDEGMPGGHDEYDDKY